MAKIPGSPSRRKKIDIELRRQKVADLYLSGKSQSQIADMLDVDPSQIGRDMKIMRQQWREEMLSDMDEIRRQEEARLRLIEDKAWESLRLSMRVKPPPGSPPDTPCGEKPCDPRFLEQLLKCYQERCKLLGLTSTEQAGGAGVTILSGFDAALALGLKKPTSHTTDGDAPKQ